MHLKLHAQLSADDYGEAQLLHAGKKRPFFIFLFLTLVLAGSGIIFAGINYSDPISLLLAPVILSVAAAISGLSVYISLPRRIKKRTTKLFLQQTSLQKPREIELSDEFYETQSDYGAAKQPWRDLHKWKFNDKIVIVYSSDILMNMFPRHWFASNDDYQAFQEVLWREIGEPGKPRKRT